MHGAEEEADVEEEMAEMGTAAEVGMAEVGTTTGEVGTTTGDGAAAEVASPGAGS